MAVDPLREIRSFLVPVDGSEAAQRALAIACDVARHNGATVSALHVIEVPRALPLEADLAAEVERGEQILTRAEQLAREHNVKLVSSLLQARDAGQALVDEAIELHTDAIVVGLNYHHRPYGRFLVGRLPEYALANAPCEVWLIRYAPEEPAEGEAAARSTAAEGEGSR